MNTTTNNTSGNADHVGPLKQPARFTAKRQPFVGAAIALLLRHRRPLTVFLAVPAIVVLSLQCVASRRAEAHVAQEHIEVAPSLAHGYSASSVAMKVPALRIVAASHHVRPDRVLGCLAFAVLSVFVAGVFPPKASAGSSATATQQIPSNNGLIAAGALCRPSLLPVRGVGLCNHGKTPECFSDHSNWIHVQTPCASIVSHMPAKAKQAAKPKPKPKGK